MQVHLQYNFITEKKGQNSKNLQEAEATDMRCTCNMRVERKAILEQENVRFFLLQNYTVEIEKNTQSEV
jgi:hypothetical protein